MVSLALALPTTRWEVLQQPTHQSNVAPQHLLLLAALDQGWAVEEPITQWREQDTRVYHFVLRHRLFTKPRVFTVPQTLLIEALVSRENWQVTD